MDRSEVESAGRPQVTPARFRRRARLWLLAGLLAPVIAYVVLDRVLHNGLLALAIVEVIPVLWWLGYGLAHGRLDPIALATAIVLLAALAVSLADGGSATPLKLRRGVVTGTLGIACLASVLGGRPLLPYVIRLVEYAWPGSARVSRIVRPYAGGRPAAVLTSIVGVTLLVDAVVQVTLALSVSTTVFLLASKLCRTGIFVSGLALCWWYASRRAVPDSDRIAGGVAGHGDA